MQDSARNGAATAGAGGPFQGLGGPRRVWVAAVLWAIGGWAGLHRMYLGQPPTCSGCGPATLWRGVQAWLHDGLNLRALVASSNTPGGALEQSAPPPRARVVELLSEKTAASFCGNRVSNTKYGASAAGILLK
jgi:hypothetical protein